jgi:tripartite-type tricarboxylate transporter receptor subunit TctC
MHDDLNLLRRGILVAAASACIDRVANAQATYPSKTVVVVSPFAPGGLNDICARSVANGLRQSFTQQSVIVENRPGGGTLIGLERVARSAPDGHVLATVTDSSMVYLPGMVSKLSYSLEDDFAPITMLCVVPTIIIVRPGLDIRSVRDLISMAKANPGKLTFGSAGIASVAHMAPELFKWRTGIDMTHVPYKGAAPALADVMAGHIDIMFADIGTAAAQVKAGRVRPIAISSLRRSPSMPDVPTIAESGVDGFEVKLWIGLAARAGTPTDIIQRLNREVVSFMQRPEVGGIIAATGAEIVTYSPERFSEIIREDRARFAPIIKAAGIKFES